MSMWNFLKGVQPPKRKQTLTDDERKAHNSDYEKKCRKRNFQSEWKKDQPWLGVETNKEDTEVMFCDFCIRRF